MIISAPSLNDAWTRCLERVLTIGTPVHPRGHRTVEVLGDTVMFDMSRPIVTCSARNLGYRFMCAEAAWMLSGDDRVSTIAPFSKMISSFSDDGMTFFGAYGPKIVAQVPYVVDALKRDPHTRQAVINIWRENPPNTKDVPCTLSCQFLLREDQLHAIVTMRSSDVWLGLPYDGFNFSMLAAFVALQLPGIVRLGKMCQTAGSRHVYDRNLSAARTITRDLNEPVAFTYPAMRTPVTWFPSQDPRDLVEHLWGLAHRDEARIRSSWLYQQLLLDTASKEETQP